MFRYTSIVISKQNDVISWYSKSADSAVCINNNFRLGHFSQPLALSLGWLTIPQVPACGTARKSFHWTITACDAQAMEDGRWQKATAGNLTATYGYVETGIKHGLTNNTLKQVLTSSVSPTISQPAHRSRHQIIHEVASAVTNLYAC